MNGTMDGDVFDQNLLSTVKAVKMKNVWVFQHHNDPKDIAMATKEWLRKKHFQGEPPSHRESVEGVECLGISATAHKTPQEQICMEEAAEALSFIFHQHHLCQF